MTPLRISLQSGTHSLLLQRLLQMKNFWPQKTKQLTFSLPPNTWMLLMAISCPKTQSSHNSAVRDNQAAYYTASPGQVTRQVQDISSKIHFEGLMPKQGSERGAGQGRGWCHLGEPHAALLGHSLGAAGSAEPLEHPHPSHITERFEAGSQPRCFQEWEEQKQLRTAVQNYRAQLTERAAPKSWWLLRRLQLT